MQTAHLLYFRFTPVAFRLTIHGTDREGCTVRHRIQPGSSSYKNLCKLHLRRSDSPVKFQMLGWHQRRSCKILRHSYRPLETLNIAITERDGVLKKWGIISEDRRSDMSPRVFRKFFCGVQTPRFFGDDVAPPTRWLEPSGALQLSTMPRSRRVAQMR